GNYVKRQPYKTRPSVVEPSGYLEWAKLLLSSATAIAAVGGAALYAIVALGYQLFYGDFGISPADVGITQTDIVAQAAVSLALLGSLTIFLLLLLRLLLAFILKYKKLWIPPLAGISTIVLVSAALILLFPVLRSPFG